MSSGAGVGASGGGLGKVGRARRGTKLFILKWRWILYFNLNVLFFFITVKSYEVDVNRSLYALLCYLVLIKSGIVQAVPWPRKPSLHS